MMRYRFGDYVLDPVHYELRQAGRRVPVEPRVFDVLAYLVQHAGQTVPTEELLAQLYPQQFAPVERLTNAVTHARKALGETSRAPRYIQTVRHRGYRFLAPVTVEPLPELDLRRPPAPEEMLDHAMAMLQRRGRLTYGTLERQFQLDDATLEDLKHELIAGQRMAVDEQGSVLVWMGPEVSVPHLTRVLEFVPFRLDLSAERLWRDTQAVPLTAKAFAVLRYLVSHAGRLVARAELVEAVWALPAVSEAALTVCIGEIRRALGDTARPPQFLETVRGRGYRFCAPVRVAPSPLGWPGGGAWPPGAVHQPELLVGREAELAQLQRWWAETQQGARQIVMVTGEAGIGKTTLVDAFVARVTATAEVWLGRGQCIEQYGAGEAYLPLLEALGHIGRGPEGGHLVELLRQQAPSWLLQLPALVPAEVYDRFQRQGAGVTRERMLRELADAVEALTVERPLVLVLEDLHWSDASTLEWLAYVARRRAAARLLVLGTYRPVDALGRAPSVRIVLPELQIHGHCVELAVAYLSHAGVATYLAQRFGALAVPEGLAQVLHARTNGNPLFLSTVVDDLVRRGLVRAGAGGWEVVAGRAAVQRGVPESLRQLLEQQLEQLPLDDQRLLEAASVAGAEFAAAAVAAVVDTALEVVEARCAAFARRGQFIQLRGTDTWPDGTVTERYGFIHALYHEAVVDQIPASRKRRWHLQIGLRKETGYGPRAREMAAELAGHFVQGRDPQRAVHYLQAASEQALQRSAYPEAVTHLTQGMALLAQWPETPARAQQELCLQMALGAALMVTQGFGHPAVEHAYARAQALCQQVGDTPALFPVLSGLWRYANGQAQHQQAGELGERLLAMAQQSGDPGLLLQAHHALWTTAYSTGAFPTARQHAEQGVMLYTPAQHHAQTEHYGGHDPGVCGRSYAAKSLWHLGYPDQAEQWNEAALALAQALGHPFTLGHTLQTAAGLHVWQRDVQLTYERATAALRLGTAQGSQYLVATSTVKLGWAVAMQGHVEAGIAQIRQALATWQTIGTLHIRAEMLALLADAYRKASRHTEGLEAVAEALEIVNTTGGRLNEAELYGLKGEILWHAGNRLEEAETCFQHQRTIACQQQAKTWELRAAISLSRLWQQQGKHAEARDLLAPVYGWFTEGFDTTDLQEAKALLEELGGYN
jgi:DNA-binding winged helix-turn-helix (wHTH) protein/predicted ATPase